jgi:hypothetical protein
MALKPLGVVLHLSASRFGDRAEINAWHKQRGFAEIGYHRVILNGRPKSGSAYDASRDGEVQKGRADRKQGAHCLAKGMNTCTYGICSVGDPGHVPAGADPADESLVKRKYLTRKQSGVLIDMLARLCIQKGWDPRGTFRNPTSGAQVPVITQHSDHDPVNKAFCASLNLEAIRRKVADRVSVLRAQGDRGGGFEAVGAGPAPGAEFEAVEEFEPAPEYEQEIGDPESDVPTDEASDDRGRGDEAEDGEEE